MIPLMSVALAVTPAEIAAEVPDALVQLDACATQGCDRSAAARAAFLVAMDTYLQEGVADGALAATVRELDAELYAGFPDVIRDAEGDPLPWALRVGGATVPVTIHEPEVRVPATQEFRRNPPSFTVQVLDHATREPIPNAVVRFVDERDNHRVNNENGVWTGTVRYLRDGSERFFDKGDVLEMEVFAPGHRYVRVTTLLGKRKKNRFTILLEPYDVVAPDGAPPVAHRAVAAWERWVDAEEVYLVEPDARTEREVAETRRLAGELAREWLDITGLDDEVALELCLVTAGRKMCTGEPRSPTGVDAPDE